MYMSYMYANQHRGFESYAPFFNFLHNHIEKACVLNVFHSFHANPMKLSMHTSYEEKMSMTLFLLGKFQGFNKYAPFSTILLIHIENVCDSNSFLSFQVTPMKLTTLDPYEELMFIQNLINLHHTNQRNFVFNFLSSLGVYMSYDI